MRHFVQCRSCSARIVLKVSADTRAEIPYFTVRCPSSDCTAREQDVVYGPADVFADEGSGEKLGGAIVVGALGALLGGPLGLVLGGLLGAGAGHSIESDARQAARRFNQS